VEPQRPVYKDDVSASLDENHKFPMKLKVYGDDSKVCTVFYLLFLYLIYRFSFSKSQVNVIACGDLECNRNLHVDLAFARDDWKNTITVREFKSRLANSGCPPFQPGWYASFFFLFFFLFGDPRFTISYFQNLFHGERSKLYDIGMTYPFPNETDTHFITFALVEPRVVSLDEHFKVDPQIVRLFYLEIYS
jgi:hypothetical protein